ncbi:carboxyl-terminal processing protease [Mesoflavibacter sabulilitoris]|uniref:Peptidase S41 n=1 Tax=Mesoflavibacter zeaxanthinifaciens subsp. sabulilitoris TaxID=1520893 RepID=A0A2T1NI67_9FLAO|nr:S41 family peptidase [Mesoflavibacter zeaxanthinifaciens]MBB3124284.1 carboxyl-terminal processing protease [Mesoflavibacter zeaxanthinifaciens subsp. sabulilitoris]PSG92613.1 peptidase S41 [Mesoflavibacter zeaxanthinifaciens subsp. sabulilitoris]
MSKFKVYIPFIIGLAVAAGIFIGGNLDFGDTSDKLFTSNSKKDKLNRLIDYIDYEYVEDVNTDSIVDVTVNGILDNLDPHSVYIPKEKMKRSAENMKGNFVGIGINFYTFKDTITVIKTVENGPSAKAGIKGGDRILEANGKSLLGETNDSLVETLRGKRYSEVKLKVYRKGEPKLLTFNVTRDVVPIKSVDAAYMLTEDLGYIKINRFAESTYKEFKKALKHLKKEGANSLVLDLRENPGGFLEIAVNIVDEFLEDNKLIVYTKNKKGDIEKSYSTSKGDFETGELFVMIDENSASASEIIAGALQDNDKGTIVGRRSYGKGLVQREMQLGDGSAVRLTVSKYYTPTGRSIQRSYANGNTDYYDDYSYRMKSGELIDESKIEVADSLKYTTPKGKVVYGGGGIIPDVFVPLNRKMENETLSFLERKGFFNNFIFEEIEKDRNYYSSISRQDFFDNYLVEDNMIKDFEEYLKIKTRSNIVFVAYREEVKHYLKATIAEQLYGFGAYHKILNKHDDMIDKVIQLHQKVEVEE